MTINLIMCVNKKLSAFLQHQEMSAVQIFWKEMSLICKSTSEKSLFFFLYVTCLAFRNNGGRKVFNIQVKSKPGTNWLAHVRYRCGASIHQGWYVHYRLHGHRSSIHRQDFRVLDGSSWVLWSRCHVVWRDRTPWNGPGVEWSVEF